MSKIIVPKSNFFIFVFFLFFLRFLKPNQLAIITCNFLFQLSENSSLTNWSEKYGSFCDEQFYRLYSVSVDGVSDFTSIEIPSPTPQINATLKLTSLRYLVYLLLINCLNRKWIIQIIKLFSSHNTLLPHTKVTFLQECQSRSIIGCSIRSQFSSIKRLFRDFTGVRKNRYFVSEHILWPAFRKKSFSTA